MRERSPRLTRVTLAGQEIRDTGSKLPAASVRLLLPEPSGLVLPRWTGNEFLLPDGRRPLIRTLTPLEADGGPDTLAVDVVRHGRGALHEWLSGLRPDDEVAVSGPGRGYAVDAGARGYVLAGDEAAAPAITQLLGVIPPTVPVTVLIEVADPSGRVSLGQTPSASVEFLEQGRDRPPGSTLVPAMRAVEIGDHWRVWVAAEAAAVQQLRRHLFEDRGLGRDQVAAHGYWKDTSLSRSPHRIPPGSTGKVEEE